MIKVIAFDFVGVLVNEKDIELTSIEKKLERMFGPNLNDADYLMEARKLIDKDSIIMNVTESLIDKLYKVKDRDIFNKIKSKYKDVKLIISTNHLSYVRNYIGEALDVSYLDDLVISAEIHKIKPHQDFYQHLLDKYAIKASELLFIDDGEDNIKAAKDMGINTIKVDDKTNIIEEIDKIMK